MVDRLRRHIHRIGIHWWSKNSSMACGNVKFIESLHDFQKYLYRWCLICQKEMPHSRYFFNLKIRERNAKSINI